ncbi:MAG: hypothetical protein KAT65_16355 [Methanophagales archaeon]|nr:hypothetical protein [Methanophagales archaeon]
MVKRAKKEKKIERKKGIKKMVLLFLEERYKGRRFTYPEIAEGIKVKPIQKYPGGVSITDNGNILNEILKELESEGRIRMEHNSSKEAKVYWVEEKGVRGNIDN